MIAITKFQSIDGVQWTSEKDALKRDALCTRVDAAMAPLGETPKAVKDGKGWLQHDLETVLCAKDAILEICREQGLNKHWECFNAQGRKCHPLSIIGRILDDNDGPLNNAWRRFCNIDDQGREHQQCYYAYTAGPTPSQCCVESRAK